MFADNLGDSKVNRDDLDRELIIDVTSQNLEGNKDNFFIAKQLVRSFEQMFKVWEDKEIRKTIIELLVNAIKPENNDELNMEILKVLDEICPEIEETDTVSNVLKKIITTEEYSLQVRSKVRSMYGETYFDLENVLFHLLNDLNISLKVRLEALEELVRIAEQKGLDEEVNKKKEEFRKKIWKMWNKKKKDNQLAEFGPVYTWALYGLGEDIKIIKQKIKDDETLQEVISEATIGSDNLSISSILNIIMLLFPFESEFSRQSEINRILENEEFMEKHGNNRQIFKYIAEEINKYEDAKLVFKYRIDTLFEGLKMENSSLTSQVSRIYLLKEIYKKANKNAREDILNKILSCPPEIKLALLPDESLLPVNLVLLNKDVTSGEYVERLFEYFEKYFKEKITGRQLAVTSFGIDYIKLSNDYAYIENVIKHLEFLKSDEPEYTKKVEQLIDILTQLKTIVTTEGISKIKIGSVNYAQAWEEYYQAVISEDNQRIAQTYQPLIAEIKAGNTLEIINPMQELYLYILSRKIRLTEEERKYRGEILGKRFKVKEITKEISDKLHSLRIDVLEKIEEILSKGLEDNEEHILKEVKEILEKEDFIRPLRAHTDDKERELFDYNEQMAKADSILSFENTGSIKAISVGDIEYGENSAAEENETDNLKNLDDEVKEDNGSAFFDGGNDIKSTEEIPLWAQYLEKIKEARALMKQGESGEKAKEEAAEIRNKVALLEEEKAGFIYDDEVYL
ncbi:MAG: hypothetical protein KAJ79_05705, partial [Candidatus Omnitrophica bacterium]|nr:hypothetical protein [Candidatus Omnitrophota bacterium]